jgi:hypothetical protein
VTAEFYVCEDSDVGVWVVTPCGLVGIDANVSEEHSVSIFKVWLPRLVGDQGKRGNMIGMEYTGIPKVVLCHVT